MEETISLAEEEMATKSYESFVSFVGDFLPSEVLSQLEEINCSKEFLEDIYNERYNTEDSLPISVLCDEMEPGTCLICERKVRLTKHHVFPREVHKSLIKKGCDPLLLNTTISICRMCHSTVHRFFSNEELAECYFTVDLLLENEKFYRYAQWASMQSNRRFHRV